MDKLRNCNICPRACGINRYKSKGLCGASDKIMVSKAFLHQWEEPCLSGQEPCSSGEKGSGTIFFSSCNLKCVFCQNHKISQEGFGKEIEIERLSQIMLELQAQGAANINLVTPTPYALHIVEAAKLAKAKGLYVPMVYNTNGYETAETIAALKDIVDIYLPDIKYYSDRYSKKYSGIDDYFDITARAVMAMYEQVGLPVFDDNGLMKKGLLIRHMLLPDLTEDTKQILRWIRDNLGKQAYVSLMCQYTPMYNAASYEEINRKLEEWEYEYIIDYFFRLGLQNGFVQEHSSATKDYVPAFDLGGV